MNISLDVIQTLGLAVIVFSFGSFVKSKVKVFQTYFIPAPVIGGIAFSFLMFALYNLDGTTIVFDKILQNFFMNIFFTCVGFTVSVKLMKQSGRQGVVLAVIAVLFLVIQNLIGVSLASVFGINKLLGIAMGSISMSGGVGSGAAFGPTLEKFGAEGATTIGVAAATFGLLMGSMIGGPVAKKLIDRHKLKSDFLTGAVNEEKNSIGAILIEKNLLNSVLIVLLGAATGTVVSMLLKITGFTFPYYVGCLFGGAIARNLADVGAFELRMKEVDILGNISLALFLSMTLMSLNINKLVDLAIPMIIILIVQATAMIVYAYFITFRSMGKSYDAAVMAAGHCGVGLGQTPNALANMSSVIEKNGPAPNAWFVLPVITVVFINIFNPIVITFFINFFK
jgi:ESS family glutamate:Na+ symporter